MRDARDFSLHPQLQADTFFVTDLPLCRVVLMNDARFPWLIAIPRIAGLSELDELTPTETAALGEESRQLQGALRHLFRPHKMNIAALGNVVPQLHLHHIARQQDDAAWPRPVWGVGTAQPYTATERDQRLTALRALLSG